MTIQKHTDDTEYNPETGMPVDDAHFECGLPKYVQESLERMKKIMGDY